MVNWIIKKILGSKNQREIKRLRPLIAQVNEFDEQFKGLGEADFVAKTAAWKERLAPIDDPIAREAVLDEIMPEAFALVKAAARHLCGQTILVCDQPIVWNMVHFDVQLIGGWALHKGRIAEMATGEGKTLVATCPVYLNALSGRGVHVVTVNDYLARRDAEWMGALFRLMGLTIGVIQHDQDPEERRAQYTCDVTYGTNSEFGFDYLRDNGMATSLDQQVQRGHNFGIVDEVDSILIDEARVPLIISGPAAFSSHQYDRYKPLVENLVRRQTVLCNQLCTEAKSLLDDGKNEDAGIVLYKVKLGQPRNKGLLRIMEDPSNRRVAEKAELAFHSDTRKEELFALKQELYFIIEERQQEANLTEKGREFLSPDDADAYVLPDLATAYSVLDVDKSLTSEQRTEQKAKLQAACDEKADAIHSVSSLLRAYCLFEKDVEYVVEENKVVIVDQFTGRKMPGRRWSDGLHQAVEAKEGVQIDRETQTLATITIQNYFRLYHKLAGMTGTAETEANEFHDIYGLDVLVIPTNQVVRRKDANDHIYKTRREKLNAVINSIKECHERGQPVLVGTVSVEQSELVSRMLKLQKIPHTILNARQHLKEAEIIARAGQRGAVTISTNMAGRGTDIKLGEGVTDLDGLMVIGTERHESRRIDRQLRGRCARQGDPGASRFYVSFEDDLMRNFGAADRMTKIMERFGLEEGQELEHPWLNKSVENAQKRVEQRNYQIRKRTLEYDDVMNKQREVVYGLRQDALESEEPGDLVREVIQEAIPMKVAEYYKIDDRQSEPDLLGLLNWVNTTFPLGLTEEKAAFPTRTEGANAEFITKTVLESYDSKMTHEDADARKSLERYIVLNAVDRLWQEHLYAMDALREGVHLRQIGQKDPLVEYKNEAYEMFTELMRAVKMEMLNNLFRSTSNLEAFEKFLASLPQQLLGAVPPEDEAGAQGEQSAGQEYGSTMGTGSAGTSFSFGARPGGGSPKPARSAAPEPEDKTAPQVTIPPKPPASTGLPRVGRNEPCPCGSGKKYKSCHGRGLV